MSFGPDGAAGRGPLAPLGRERLLPVWLVVAGAACYANALTSPFVFDDSLLDDDRATPNRPVTAASFLLNRALSGSATWSYHVFNVLVHLGAGLLLYGILRRTLEFAAPRIHARTRTGLAFSVALLWLVHPLQTQAVTYLSQRAESMAGLFYLGALYGLIRSAETNRPLLWQLAALASFALGTATKEIVFTAPVLLLLYDRTFLAGSFAGALRRRRNFYAGLGAAWVLAFALFAGPELSTPGKTAGFGVEGMSPLAYACTQPAVILHYLRLAFWPHPLCLDYGWPLAHGIADAFPHVLVVGALLAGTAWALARRHWLGFAGAWFFVILAPTSSFVPIQDAAFEHRMYLSLAAVLLTVLVAVWKASGAFAGRNAPWAGALVAVLAAASLVVTLRRNQDYASAVTLWKTVVARAPGNARGHCNLGHALVAEGRFDEALAELEQALALRPGFPQALVAAGNAHVGLRSRAPDELDKAAACYRRALALAPSASAHNGLENALFHAGAFPAAEGEYRAALALEPTKAILHYGLANAQLGQGDRAAALLDYEEALRLEPDFEDAHTNLAALLDELGRPDEALTHYRRALEIPPRTAEEHFNLGRHLLAHGADDEALAEFRAACRTDAHMIDALQITARLLALRAQSTPEERGEAVDLAERARSLAGDGAVVLETLGLAQAAAGEPAQAARTFESALAAPDLDPAMATRLGALLAQQRARIR